MGALAPNWMQAVAQSVSLLTVREKSVKDLQYVPFAMTTLGALFSLHKYQVTRLNLVSRFSSREINGDRNLSNRDEKERKKERKKERR